MSGDIIERSGRDAYQDGWDAQHCPYKDCTEAVLRDGYWQTDAGMRQRWMRGWLLAANNATATLVR